MKKSLHILLLLGVLVLFNSQVSAQDSKSLDIDPNPVIVTTDATPTVSSPAEVLFSDGFETYTAGQLLACQAPTLWTTWSNAACGGEDALVSSDFAYAGTNSVKVITDDDLIKKFGATAYTSGKYKISMYVYIPTGKAGYLNTLATFAGNSSAWALEVYFDATGG
ncbi:MAG: hypothetical protein Q8Q47_03110, partial [Ignavibacteriaceae bacterium]|nr:hypothetical protein [Ignavibacteriaceae bacterium]